jgi:hypothetical protein
MSWKTRAWLENFTGTRFPENAVPDQEFYDGGQSEE